MSHDFMIPSLLQIKIKKEKKNESFKNYSKEKYFFLRRMWRILKARWRNERVDFNNSTHLMEREETRGLISPRKR